MPVPKKKATKRKRHWSHELMRRDACSEAVRFARRYKTFPAAWKACAEPGWLLWVVERWLDSKKYDRIVKVMHRYPMSDQHVGERSGAHCPGCRAEANSLRSLIADHAPTPYPKLSALRME